MSDVERGSGTDQAQDEGTVKGPSRRRFITLGVLGGSGLALGFYLAFGGETVSSLEESWGESPGGWFPNAWLRVNADGTVTVRVNHTELGQGVTTGLSTIVAEEMDLDWAQVRFEIAPVEPIYKNPLFGMQSTGGSTSVKGSWDILREAGAAARAMLVQAAAAQWGVDAAECRTEAGRVVHADSGQTAAYGALSALAAQVTPTGEVALKDPSDFRLIGTDVPRLDVQEKIQGTAVFGADVRLPGMLAATLVHPPVFGDRAESFDASRALAQPGVRRVLRVHRSVAVVADTFWQAARAAELVSIQWAGRGDQGLSSEGLWGRWAGLAGGDDAEDLQDLGDAGAALGGAAQVVEAVYRLPFQAHAAAEPMGCTAHVERDRCRVWAPTQNQDGAQEVAARITGLSYSQVDVITTYAGGGFGGRTQVGYVAEAVYLSRVMEAPVKVLWTREEDIQHDFYRPASYHVLRAGLDGDGRPVAWSHRIVGPDPTAAAAPGMFPSILPYWVPRRLRNAATWLGGKALPGLLSGDGVVGGAAPLPYGIANVRVDYVRDDPGVPAGFWRSVANSTNGFVVEGFMDEVAAAAGRDPLELRSSLLQGAPHHLQVLELAAREAGWEEGLTGRLPRGLAVCEFDDTFVAMVADVSVDGSRIQVDRVVCAVDCGRVLNPRIVRTQVAGGLIFGLTATLKGEITVEGGRVRESNFHDFPVLTLAETPEVEVHLVDTDRRPSGIGESGVPPIAPAVANAVYSATGTRLRRLPLRLA